MASKDGKYSDAHIRKTAEKIAAAAAARRQSGDDNWTKMLKAYQKARGS